MFDPLNGGAVIANTSNHNNDNNAFPSVIKVPDWIAPQDRPDPTANHYLYYGNHSGHAIQMTEAASIDGTWTDYDFTTGIGPNPSDGVFDIGVDTNDPSRNNFDHISAPEAITEAVTLAQGLDYDAERYADPVSLGDIEFFTDDDGQQYMFFSYVSAEFGGTQGEGQITAIRVIPEPGTLALLGLGGLLAARRRRRA